MFLKGKVRFGLVWFIVSCRSRISSPPVSTSRCKTSSISPFLIVHCFVLWTFACCRVSVPSKSLEQVFPYSNPAETYQYYSLPFCPSADGKKEERHFGELLVGSRKASLTRDRNTSVLSWEQIMMQTIYVGKNMMRGLSGRSI